MNERHHARSLQELRIIDEWIESCVAHVLDKATRLLRSHFESYVDIRAQSGDAVGNYGLSSK